MSDKPSTNDRFVETQRWIAQTFGDVPRGHPHEDILLKMRMAADSAIRAGIEQAGEIVRLAIALRRQEPK